MTNLHNLRYDLRRSFLLKALNPTNSQIINTHTETVPHIISNRCLSKRFFKDSTSTYK